MALLAAVSGSRAAEPAPAAGLPAWLVGGWSMQSDNGGWSEEWWTTPRGGLMMGAGRSGKGDEVEWWEHTRIERNGGTMRFCALPKGQPGACFNAAKVSANQIVFENPGHDFPTRVAYRRDGDQLFAEISGKGGSNPQRWTFRRIR